MDTLGSLIDKLTIVNLKIFKQEDIKRMPDLSNDAIADATKATNILNTQRNDLIQEIDELFVDVVEGSKKMKLYKQGTTKSYGK